MKEQKKIAAAKLNYNNQDDFPVFEDGWDEALDQLSVIVEGMISNGGDGDLTLVLVHIENLKHL